MSYIGCTRCKREAISRAIALVSQRGDEVKVCVWVRIVAQGDRRESAVVQWTSCWYEMFLFSCLPAAPSTRSIKHRDHV